MTSESDRSDVLILGGGVMGCALAYYLAVEHGHSVALYEKETLGSGASGKAGGLISAQCWCDDDVRLVEESKREYGRISGLASISIIEQTGGVRTVSSEEGVSGIKTMRDRLKKLGVEARIIYEKQLSEMFPQGRFEGIMGALYTPTDGTLLPADLTSLYGRLAQEEGARIEYSNSGARVSRDGDHWTLSAQGIDLSAGQLVVACGAWSKKVLNGLGLSAPLSPYLTRACLLKAGVKGGFPYLHDNDLDVYVRSFPGGDILAGDGTELREIDPDLVDSANDMAFLENIAGFMEQRFPAWAGCSVGTAWRGVVTSTPDRRPLIGRYPGVDGLYLATGFNGFGIMRAGGAAMRLSLGIAKGDWRNLSACDPARFPPPHKPFVPTPGFTLT